MPDTPDNKLEPSEIIDVDVIEETEDTGKHGGGKGWKIAAIVAVLAAALALGVLGSLLFAGGDSEDTPDADVRACIPSRDFTDDGSGGDTCPPEGARRIDGLVQKTSKGGFTIRRIEGGSLGEEVELHVRPADRPYIDIAHAQTHAALGQPIRVFLEEVDGRDAVVYMMDAPLVR